MAGRDTASSRRTSEYCSGHYGNGRNGSLCLNEPGSYIFFPFFSFFAIEGKRTVRYEWKELRVVTVKRTENGLTRLLAWALQGKNSSLWLRTREPFDRRLKKVCVCACVFGPFTPPFTPLELRAHSRVSC